MKKRIAMIMTAMLTAAAIAPCAYAEAETEAVPGTSLDNPMIRTPKVSAVAPSACNC